MEDITQQIAHFVISKNSHASLIGIIRNNLKRQIPKKRKEYWAVTDTTNPVQTYFKIKHPEHYKDSIETKKKFALGNKQHAILQKKLEFIEGFFDREMTLDGRLLGLRLVGRVDAKINGNLWEIKSKENLPNNKEELIEKYPQDIEQLCFYSLIDPEFPKDNVLILTTHLNKEFKAFNIKINDLGKIKNVVLRRMEKLDSWLDEEGLPAIQFRCRYCHDDCSIKAQKLCSFFENPILSCEVKNFIEISESPEIEEQLKQIKIYEEDVDYFSIFNIIIPRQIIYEGQYPEIEKEPYDNSYKKQHQQLIQSVLYDEKMYITNEELKRLKEKQKVSEISQYKNNFIKLNLSGEEKIYPLLIHISDSTNPFVLTNISDYKKGELGIHCLNNGTNKGYLVSYFPEQDNEVRVFEINYNFEKGTLSKIKKIVEILKTKDKERVDELLTCPVFMCWTCVYSDKCGVRNKV